MKYYVMLIDPTNQQMRVPVKALLNPYNGRPAYCAGMPQFFGGTDNDDQPPPVVLDQEVTQESRRSLELTAHDPHHFFDHENMFYYWAGGNEWIVTGTPWGPARNAAEAEMDRIEIVDLTRFNAQWTDDQLIAELIRQTNSTGAPARGQADFNGSATREAFIRLLRLVLA